MAIKKILAVGAGTMGSQASFYYAMNGFDVTQYDLDADALVACKQHHKAYVDAYRLARPSVTDEDIQAGLERICYSSDLAEACRDVDLVTESVPEVLDIKQMVYTELARFCPAHTIFTTNTSTLPPSAIAPFTGRPGRFLALHYAMGIWNAPVAEVMKHPGTEDSIFLQVVDFVESAKLVPIKLEKEQPGYVVNTLLVPWLNAGLYLVVNDICSHQDVDKTWMLCSGGMPMGPMGVLDQVGFGVARNINRLLAAAEPNNPQYQKNTDYLEKNFISKGHMGALSGKGFYTYPNPEYAQPGFLE